MIQAFGNRQIEDLFSRYKSLFYKRAFCRGYGLCQQHALAFTSLLEERYDIPTYVLSLRGHIIVEAHLARGESYLIDPSFGIIAPFGLKDVARHKGWLLTHYAEVDRRRFAQLYIDANNIRCDISGTQGHRPKLYWLEYLSDCAKWIIPVILIVFSFVLKSRHSGEKQSD